MRHSFFSRPLRAAAVVAVLAGSMSAPALAQPVQGGTASLLLSTEPPTLVTIAHVHSSALAVSAKVTEGLLKYDFDLNPQPQLASSWTISPDGKQYTFALRQGVKWHDGRDFTSADVAYSIELLKTVHPRGRGTFASVDRVETPDAHTVVLHLSQPAPYLIKALAAAESPIVPRHLYEGTDALASPNGNAPIGTGPFRFKEWVRGSHIVFERNPEYWDQPKPYLDRLIVRVIPDASARAIAFETGDVDLGFRTPVAPTDLERLKGVKHLQFSTDGASYSYNVTKLEFNLENTYFSHPKVRQAVAHAINREVIKNVVYSGYASITYSPIAPGLVAFSDQTPVYPFDTKKADQLLDEAGYPRAAGGVRFSVPLDYNPNETNRRTAEYLRAALARVGIDATVRAQDTPAYVKRIYTAHDFAFTVGSTSNLFDPTVGVQRHYWSKNIRPGVPYSNGTYYRSKVVDDLLERASVEPDATARAALFKQFQQEVARDVPDISLVSPSYVTVSNARIHDHTLTADGLEGNLAEAYIKP